MCFELKVLMNPPSKKKKPTMHNKKWGNSHMHFFNMLLGEKKAFWEKHLLRCLKCRVDSAGLERWISAL
jgi:hypothetical protein